PRSLDDFLREANRLCELDELAFLADAFGELPRSTSLEGDDVRRRHRDKEVLAGMLERLISGNARVAEAIQATISRYNHDSDLLGQLLERQNYRLASWRAAGRDLG